MAARIVSVAFEGVEARRVDVEVQAAGGAVAFVVVGLADKAVAEARERVRAAFAGLGLALPSRRLVVNLAPADLPKEGNHFDLPIALAVMSVMGIIPPGRPRRLGCDRRAQSQRRDRAGGRRPAGRHRRRIHGPWPDLSGDLRSLAAWAGETAPAGAALADRLVNHFRGGQLLGAPKPGAMIRRSGRRTSRRQGSGGGQAGLEIAAAGGHNLLYVGPPGSGKSMLAQRLPGLLPPLSPANCSRPRWSIPWRACSPAAR